MTLVALTVAVVVERTGRFLVTKEEREGIGRVWYLPTGAVEPGESLPEAAYREVLEETGYAIEPTHLLCLDHGYFPRQPDVAWWRPVLAARVVDSEPVAIPDPETLHVAWLTPEELTGKSLRNPDLVDLLRIHADQGPGLPLDRYRFALDGALEGFFR